MKHGNTKLAIPLLVLALTGCGAVSGLETGTQTAVTQTETAAAAEATAETLTQQSEKTGSAAEELVPGEDATEASLEDGKDYTITAAGTYRFQGTAVNATIIVEAGDEDTVEILLDGVMMANDNFPCIYVKNAGKVLVFSETDSNSLTVTGTFRADGTTNTDAVIFSKDDLVLCGEGSIRIESTANGITSKDDLKIASGTLLVTSTEDALEANNSIEVTGGNLSIVSQKDGLHAEYDEDDREGSILITGGRLEIEATDDAIHGTTTVRIDGGDLTLTAAEGIEATVIEINGGSMEIAASDDGINASAKSTFATPSLTVNDGSLKITMGAGDTDALDSNGNLYINGGTLEIMAQSPYDYDGEGVFTGGTLIVNGVQTDSLSNQFMGGGPGGRPGGRGPAGEGGSKRGRGGF